MNRLTEHAVKDRNVAVTGRRDSTALEAARPEVHGSICTPFIQCKASCACGGGCPRCQSRSRFQAKLKIGQPNDRYEQEADRVANQVMRMPDPVIQLKPG